MLTTKHFDDIIGSTEVIILNVNDRIKKIREKANLTQDAFAQKINMTRNSVTLIECDKRNPSERTILDICEKFNVNYDWLKHGNGEIYKESNDSIMMLLKSEYNLDEIDIKIIEQYLTLSPIERQIFKNYIKNIGNA